MMDNFVIRKLILGHAQGLKEIVEAGWFSLQPHVVHRESTFGKKPPIYPQIIHGLYGDSSSPSLRAPAGGMEIQGQYSSLLKMFLKFKTGLLRPALCRARNDEWSSLCG